MTFSAKICPGRASSVERDTLYEQFVAMFQRLFHWVGAADVSDTLSEVRQSNCSTLQHASKRGSRKFGQ